MIEKLFELILFFSLTLVYFYSLSGYGKILFNENKNFFDLQLNGTIILLLVSYSLYLSIGINLLINTIILFFGLVLFFIYKKKINSIKFRYILLLILSIFSVLIISKTHEDFHLYHYFSIYEVFNNKLRIGISTINNYYIHASHLSFNQALTVLPYVNFKIIHLPVFIIYICVIGYFAFISFSKKTKKEELFFSILCVFILLIKFNRLSEFGYDYISQFILLVVFHKIYFLNSDENEVIKSIYFFILSVLIKPISLLFSPFLLFILYKKSFGFYKKITLSKYCFIFFLISTLLSSSFFKTGCIFYPLNTTCFSKDKIFWSKKEMVRSYSEIVSLWAKGYDSQNSSKYKKIGDKKLFNKNFNWVKYWVENHFFYKISEFLLIVIISFFLIYFYFSRLKLEVNNQKKNKQILLLLSFLSILFWFNTVPQFRFGFSSIIIFIFLIFNLILNLNIEFNKKKLIHLLIFGLLILNVKNLNRINNEFSRNDFFKFINFPFYNEKEVKYNYSKLKRSKILHVEVLK